MKNNDKTSAELKYLSAVNDDEIDTTDIPEITDFSQAERGRFFRPVKKQVTLRIDMDLIEWFKQQGAGYQTRINSALREFVEDHQKIGHS
jgi:uncharacterized protein (DUF4415 family)